ncbi:uncharacterized protein SPPG_07186 [Spizellomyces punctatus DAOM BR117]|uniref:Uncharacterized protein n=1 Tax=Spizellomyces punctatus (strain DAOM BR117) TaxID=645134 RepID=A0A0L0HA01_SPIPD|nr:uncharacterized protein SPPG_07186 [Spizellomyces punctatus DAOM BR117]KNC97724.1 hypothetical protein SPPG_07186 [Spizellomyces punctatus DAOM BR117]|eukprot:XP_016605764.1 hypothetical protein SPPG_07186 [Spizellomyces punctatus DAOM BR117]
MPPLPECTPDQDPRKDLNIHRTYHETSTSFTTQREFLQNWIDQCRSLARGEPAFVATECRVGNVGKVRFFGVCDKTTLLALGYVCELILTDPKGEAAVRTYFTNYGTVLKRHMMAMGKSSKRNDTRSAGYFGEGVKVAINRLTAEGARVRYFTGWNLWTFEYDQEDILQLRFQHLSSPQATTAIVDLLNDSGVRFPLRRNFTLRPIDTADYLFLHRAAYPNIQTNILRTTDIEVIVDVPELFGNLYVKDIKCIADTDLRVKGRVDGKSVEWGFAVNYIGPQTNYNLLGLSRDRNTLYPGKILRFVPGLFSSLDTLISPSDKRTFAAYLLKMLMQQSQTSGGLSNQLRNSNDRKVDQIFADYIFFALASSVAMRPLVEDDLQHFFPFLKYEQDDAKQATYLGAYVIEVPQDVFNILELSRFYQKLTQLWDRKKEEAKRQPDYDLSPIAAFADDLCKAIYSFFQIPREAIAFKAFPINRENPNQTVVIDVPVPNLPSGKGYIIDGNLLNRPAAHRIQRKQTGEKCDRTDCMCVQMCVIDALKVLLSNGNRSMQRKLEKTMLRRSLEGFMQNLPPSVAQEEEEQQKIGSAFSNPREQETNPGGTPLRSSSTGEAGNRRHTGTKTQPPPDIAQDTGDEGPRLPVKPTDLESLANDIVRDVQEYARNASSSAPDSILHVANPVKKWKLVTCDGCPCLNLVKVHNLYIDANTTSPPGAEILNLRDVFWDLVLAPLANLFKYPKTKVHIFWEGKGLIAFNKGGILYYNLRYFDVLHRKRVESYEIPEVLMWWFVIFAHECAHNVASGHDKEHEWAEEILIQKHLSDLMELCTTYKNY